MSVRLGMYFDLGLDRYGIAKDHYGTAQDFKGLFSHHYGIVSHCKMFQDCYGSLRFVSDLFEIVNGPSGIFKNPDRIFKDRFGTPHKNFHFVTSRK